jgi:hypothetical protein
MNNQIIENIIKFLDRTQLSGAEVPAFVEAKQHLISLYEGEKTNKEKTKNNYNQICQIQPNYPTEEKNTNSQ